MNVALLLDPLAIVLVLWTPPSPCTANAIIAMRSVASSVQSYVDPSPESHNLRARAAVAPPDTSTLPPSSLVNPLGTLMATPASSVTAGE